jgi:hypothetical protein
MLHKIIKTRALSGALLFSISIAQAGSLENLERERAIAIETMLSPSLKAEERLDRAMISKRRLVDLERMVIRDKKLAQNNTPIVRTAFENYNLTFLVHASTEANKTLLDHWLEEIGVSTHSLGTARIGRR